jgi:hypothetical protein
MKKTWPDLFHFEDSLLLMHSTTIMAKQEVSLRTTSKEVKSLPKGAIVLSKDVRTSVEEIENGYLAIKTVEYRYSTGTGEKLQTDWLTITKKWFSAEDPLEIKLSSKDKSLADAFNAD